MKKGLVSIIVPVYNAEAFIEDTLKTVICQTYNKWELILVDDISTDNSVDIIKKYIKKEKRIKIIKLDKKGMAAGARNRGILEAQGEYICYLDADDFWEKDKLEKQVEFFSVKPCAFLYTGYQFVSTNGQKTGKKVFVPIRLTYKQALKNTTIWTTTVMFNMNFITKNEIYMPIVYSEDTASWWKILRSGYIAYGINEILSYYRRSENTLSSNKKEAIKRIWYLYRNVENLSLFSSFYNFCFYLVNAIRRRI